jgi:hypothetical protein
MNKWHAFPIFLLLLAMMSWVVRAETEPTSTPGPGTGLEGTISISPSHGGPQREGDPSSAPLANIDFVVKKGNDLNAAFKTDDKGWFRISLAPGHYTVSRKEPGGKIGRYGPFEIDVVAGHMTKVEWMCDTGLR